MRLIPCMAYQAAETATFGECMTDIEVCPATCPHSHASQDVLVQFGVDLPFGAQNVALRTASSTIDAFPSKCISLGNSCIPISRSATQGPRAPKQLIQPLFAKSARTGSRAAGNFHKTAPNLYLIHTLPTISLEAEYRSMLKQRFRNEPLVGNHGLQAFLDIVVMFLFFRLEQLRPTSEDSRTTPWSPAKYAHG